MSEAEGEDFSSAPSTGRSKRPRATALDSSSVSDEDEDEDEDDGPYGGRAAGGGVAARAEPLDEASDEEEDDDNDSCASNPVDGPLMYAKFYAQVVAQVFKDASAKEMGTKPEGLDHATFRANVEHIKKLHPGKFDEETERDLWLHVVCNQYARGKSLQSGERWEDWSHMRHYYEDGVLNRFTGCAAGRKKRKKKRRVLDWDLSGIDSERLETRDPNLLLTREFLEEHGFTDLSRGGRDDKLGEIFEMMCFADHLSRKKREPKQSSLFRRSYPTYEFHKEDKEWMRDTLFETMKSILQRGPTAPGRPQRSGAAATAAYAPAEGRRPEAGGPQGLRPAPRAFDLRSSGAPLDRPPGPSTFGPRELRSAEGPKGLRPAVSPLSAGHRLGVPAAAGAAGGSSSSLSGDFDGYGSDYDQSGGKQQGSRERIYWGTVLEEDLRLPERLEACTIEQQQSIMRVMERPDLDDCVRKIAMECGGLFHRKFRREGRPARIDGKSAYFETDRKDMVDIARKYVHGTIGRFVSLDASLGDADSAPLISWNEAGG